MRLTRIATLSYPGLILAAFVLGCVQSGRNATDSSVVDRLAPLTAQQKKGVESVLLDTDELDSIFKGKDSPSRKADRFNKKFKTTFTNFQHVHDSLPKNDARMMLYNMMDGYSQAGLLIVGNGRGMTKEDATPSMAVAVIRKAFLKHIIAGTLSEDEIKILKDLRKQDN